MKFTPEQRSAIYTSDKTLLVSAAAGSGKTATLTARIIESLTRENEPQDINKMLIVTFTNAAVGELRDRISMAVEKAIKEHPENKSLLRQHTLLPMAKILTIDAFCNDILKKNSDKVGIAPNYRIADSAEVEILSFSILSGLINSFYENEFPEIMSAEDFSRLADTLTSAKQNASLEEIFLKLYEKTKSSVEGVSIFSRYAELYENENPTDNRYTRYAIEEIRAAQSHHEKTLKSLILKLVEEGTKQSEGYAATLRSDLDAISRLVSCESYAEMKSKLDTLSFTGMPSVRAQDKTPLLLKTASLRNAMKEDFSDLKNKFFFYSEEELEKLFSDMSGEIKKLSAFLSLFDEIYNAEKTKRLALEYSDIERYAYRALYNEDGTPSDFALSLRREFDAVYIDEYQDVNALQASIFDAISKPTNRFMVGDIKQSIYGFRNAEPDIFASMKKSFPPLEESNCQDGASIFMSRNFRSDETIINFVNEVFDKAFGLTAKSIGYVEEDRLVFGKKYADGEAPSNCEPEFILIPDVKDEEDGESKRRELECLAVAEKISKILSSGRLNNGKPVEPSDIAIILRGNRERMNDYAKALQKFGIESEKADDKSFFLNSDVLLALCLLNSVDNPEKDIYLAGLMSSPLFSFTADELFKIRRKGQGSLFKSLKSYIADNPGFEKGAAFIKKLELYRTLAEGSKIDEFILKLYNDTGLLSLAEANGGGENLLLLYNYAKSFSASSLKGLYNFIKFINNTIERGAKFDSKRDSDAKNAVKIMTVHSSKGLEYPIVFYADTDTALIDRDGSDKVLFLEKFGISFRRRSSLGLALVESPVHNIIAAFSKKRYFEEELRVIYVALTRAREKLFVVGCVPEFVDETLEKVAIKSEFLDEYSIYKTKSPLELMLSCVSNAKISVYENEQTEEDETENEEKLEIADSFTLSETELSDRIFFEYENLHLTRIPEKLSVSFLSPTVLDGEENEKIELTIEKEKETKPKREAIPDFISGTKKDESAKRGIATHNYLQFFDIKSFAEKGAVAELARLEKEGFISKETAERVRISEIELFGKSRFFEEMKSARKVYRELRFNTRLPARFFTENEKLKAKLGDEKLLVQGVIDCILEDSAGNIHLVDYKTDRLTKEELESRALCERKLNESHARQLSYYREAIKVIFGKEPKSVRIYSLPLGDTVDIQTINFK